MYFHSYSSFPSDFVFKAPKKSNTKNQHSFDKLDDIFDSKIESRDVETLDDEDLNTSSNNSEINDDAINTNDDIIDFKKGIDFVYLNEKDILTLRNLINYKFNSTNIEFFQPFIQSTLKLINENNKKLVTQSINQLNYIKYLTQQVEKRVINNCKLSKDVLDKIQNFNQSMKNTHQEIKTLKYIPFFHKLFINFSSFAFSVSSYLYNAIKNIIYKICDSN